MNLEDIGLTNDDLQERVIAQCVEQLLHGTAYDEDGEPYDKPSSIMSKMREECKKRIDDSVTSIANDKMLPIIRDRIDEIVLQQTNEWGEKKGSAMSFTEYLVARAEAYMHEKVDSNGKSKSESGGYSWSGTQTRLTSLIHAHFQYSIQNALKDAFGTATGELAKAIHETARIKLNEIAASLKVSAQIK